MLTRLITTKGEEVWVNPIHVRWLRAKGEGCEVSVDPVYLVLKIPRPAADVAAELNAFMPPLAYLPEAPPPPGD